MNLSLLKRLEQRARADHQQTAMDPLDRPPRQQAHADADGKQENQRQCGHTTTYGGVHDHVPVADRSPVSSVGIGDGRADGVTVNYRGYDPSVDYVGRIGRMVRQRLEIADG